MKPQSFSSVSVLPFPQSDACRAPDERGVYLVFLAVLLVPLLYVIGMAIDSAQLEIDSLRVQRAADAGAVVGASLIARKTDPEVVAVARAVARDNYDRNVLFYDPAQLDQYIAVPALVTSSTLRVTAVTRSQTHIIGKFVSGEDEYSPAGRAVAQRRPVAIAIVADVTGSMLCPSVGSCGSYGAPAGSRKIDALKVAAKQFVNEFSEQRDFIALVSYSTYLSTSASQYYKHRVHDYPLNQDYSDVNFINFSKTNIRNKIDGLVANGGTNIQSGVLGGIDELMRLEPMLQAQTRQDASEFLKVLLLITDGSPNAYLGDISKSVYPQSNVDQIGIPSGCPAPTGREKYYLYPVRLIEWARQQGILVFTIGVGQPINNSTNFYQGGDQSSSNDNYLRTYFMHYLANSPIAHVDSNGNPLPVPAAEQPHASCASSYEQLSNTARGEYLESPNANDLQSMLQRVALMIQMRLIE